MAADLFVVDAFTAEPFRGNPAAVCLLERARDPAWMQSVAAEMNLSETAFVVPRAERGAFDLRWFTPLAEVALCGHATLASAHVLYETGRLAAHELARFLTASDWLTARRGTVLEIDLPAGRVVPEEPPAEVLRAARSRPVATGRAIRRVPIDQDWLLELADEEAVRGLRPDFALLREVRARLVVTARARSSDYDIVSRYFAPDVGIDEDPVTGAAHCVLAPYWGGKLGRSELRGYQASARGGYVAMRLEGSESANPRVVLGGPAVTVARGSLLA